MTRVIPVASRGDNYTTSGGRWQLTENYVVEGPEHSTSVFNATDTASGLRLPRHNSTHPQSPALIFNANDGLSISFASLGEYGPIWDVSVTYNSNVWSDPENGPTIRWRWDEAVESQDVAWDVANNALVNTAGDPITGGIPDEVYNHTLMVSREEPLFSPAFASQYRGRVNAAALSVLGFTIPAETMRCTSIKPEGEQTPQSSTVTVVYQFLFKDGTRPHDPRVADVGFRGWAASATAPFYSSALTDDEPIDTPTLLDGTGKPIASHVRVGPQRATPAANPSIPSWVIIDPDSPAGTKLLIFRRRRTASFSGLLPPVM